MISYEIYKILHILGVVMIFMGLAGVLFAMATGAQMKAQLRMLGFVTHGLGLLLALTGGFGMLARLGTHELPGWIYGKIAIWVLSGTAISVSKRRPQWALQLVIFYCVLVVGAVYLALFKPF